MGAGRAPGHLPPGPCGGRSLSHCSQGLLRPDPAADSRAHRGSAVGNRVRPNGPPKLRTPHAAARSLGTAARSVRSPRARVCGSRRPAHYLARKEPRAEGSRAPPGGGGVVGRVVGRGEEAARARPRGADPRRPRRPGHLLPPGRQPAGRGRRFVCLVRRVEGEGSPVGPALVGVRPLLRLELRRGVPEWFRANEMKEKPQLDVSTAQVPGTVNALQRPPWGFRPAPVRGPHVRPLQYGSLIEL